MIDKKVTAEKIASFIAIFGLLLVLPLFLPRQALADDATTTASMTTTTTTTANDPMVDSTTTNTVSTTTTPGMVSLHVRYQDFVAFDGIIPLPAATTTTLDDASGTPHDISSDSALYLLSLAEQASPSAFSVSDLDYYSSFGELYLNCLDINATTTIHACADWQYAVNGSNPDVGSDQYIAAPGDDIYFYYGSPRQFFVSATSTDTATPITVTVQKYDYTNNAWLPLSGEIVDVTEPNPNDEWDPFIIATSTSDTNGLASLLIPTAGTYNIGLAEDGYYPTKVTVSTSTASGTTSPASGGSNGSDGSGSSGGNGSGDQGYTNGSDPGGHNSMNVANALQFLAAHQNSDGSFSSSMYTDWAAIALTAGPQSQSRAEITDYEKSESNPAESASDYERHAMALEALGINPYDGTSVNYIQAIVNDFNGTEVGDPTLVNDDIFAIFPLVKAGYTSGDSITQKTVAFIISKQAADGSWAESVDLTAAAIQALSMVQFQTPSLSGVGQAISNATTYLRANQQADGGFGSSDSTSWALQAIAALGQSPTNWIGNNNSPDNGGSSNSSSDLDPDDYLYNDQQSDGGLDPTTEDQNSRIWATSYAIPAALSEPWADILSSFSKQSTAEAGNSTGLGDSTGTSSNDAAMPTTTTNSIDQTATSTSSINANTSAANTTTTPVLPIERASSQPQKIHQGTKEEPENKNEIATSVFTTGNTDQNQFLQNQSSRNGRETNELAAAGAGETNDTAPLTFFGVLAGLAVIGAGLFLLLKVKLKNIKP